MTQSTWQKNEQKARDEAGTAVEQYMDQIGKYDFRTLSKAEFEEFKLIFASTYSGRSREVMSEALDAIPF